MESDNHLRIQADDYMTRRLDKNKMATTLIRIGRSNSSSFLPIHHLKRLCQCRKLSVSNSCFYSTENAPSTAEEFSLRYLEGEHEGTTIFDLSFVSRFTLVTCLSKLSLILMTEYISKL